MIKRFPVRNRRTGMAVGLVIIALFLIVLIAIGASAADKKKEKVTIFEVPTTGQITDVQYRPEFDEWWVTCREGENISVYSYDKRSQRWGQAVFTPRKPDDKTPKGVTREKERGQIPEDPEAAAAAAKSREGHKAEDVKPDAGKEAGKGTKDDKKRWWDPLNLIRQGEWLIPPFH